MRRIAGGMVLLFVAAAANAETLPVWVDYPAASAQAAALRSIRVEQLGGDVGPDLEIQIEDALRAVDLGGGPYFRIVPGVSGADAEAQLTGTAHTEQRFEDYTEEHERCVKDASGDCTSAKEKFTAKCRRRHVDLVVTLRLIGRDGALIWSDNRPEGYDDSSCEDSTSSPRSRSAVGRDLAVRVAQRVRGDLAQHRMQESWRVDENRKGLSKADSDTFKAAVKATKGHVDEACRIWSDLAQRNPQHAPTLFNVGLCAESSGADQRSVTGAYQQVLALDPKHKYARQALDRLAMDARARRQLAAHAAN